MIKRYLILPVLLVFLISAGLSLGQTANNTSTVKNNTTLELNVTAPANQTSPANETAAANATSTIANLNYIWSVNGIEVGPVTMALNQDGNDLFGQAKYEPDSGQAWNAEVVGSVLGDSVELTITAQKGSELVTTKMSGTFANESISGNFTQVSGGKMVNKGTFSAMWIMPDTSSYTPATIEQPKDKTTSTAQNTNSVASETNTTGQTTTTQKSRFVDVREYKDKIGPGGDLSGVPPGMGGSGLN